MILDKANKQTKIINNKFFQNLFDYFITKQITDT